MNRYYKPLAVVGVILAAVAYSSFVNDDWNRHEHPHHDHSDKYHEHSHSESSIQKFPKAIEEA